MLRKIIVSLVVSSAALAAVAASAADGEERTTYAVDVRVVQTDDTRVEGTVRGHLLVVDQPVAFGGSDTAPTPPETYAFALGACVVSAVRFVASLEQADVSAIEARVTGTLDFARAMGRPDAPRAGFAGLGVEVEFAAPWSEVEKSAFLARVVERCPICDNTAERTSLRVELAAPGTR